MLDFLDPTEVIAAPDRGRRWIELGREWLTEKQRQGKYAGRNGYEAERVLRRTSEIAPHGPERTTEQDLIELLSRLSPGAAPKTARAYLGIWGSFLSSRGNWVVQESRIRERYPNRATRTPIVPPEDRDRVLNAAVGQERVVTAMLAVGRRRVEIIRSMVGDYHLDHIPPEYDVREKGGHGSVSATFPAPARLRAELAWYLPYRAAWASRCSRDSGHLLCREDHGRLVGVSAAYADRLLHSAERRAGTAPWPCHAFRRGVATTLRARGADWEDVSAALGHRSPETTRLYVEPLVRRSRMASALELLETPGRM